MAEEYRDQRRHAHILSPRCCLAHDHMLWRLCGSKCDIGTLREALVATCEKRGSTVRIERWQQVLAEVEQDEAMLALWDKYAHKNPYASDIDFMECCKTAGEVMMEIG